MVEKSALLVFFAIFKARSVSVGKLLNNKWIVYRTALSQELVHAKNESR